MSKKEPVKQDFKGTHTCTSQDSVSSEQLEKIDGEHKEAPF